MKSPLLLAIDPSLRCTGWLLVALDGTRELVRAGAIETVRGDDVVDAIGQHHDAGHRVVALYRGLVATASAFRQRIEVAALETPLGSQDSAAAWALGRAQAATRCALAEVVPEIAPIAVSPFEAKLAATGTKRPKHPKRDVAAGVRARFGPGAVARVLEHIGTSREREAVYDAGAVALVALRHRAARLVIKDHAAACRTERGIV